MTKAAIAKLNRLAEKIEAAQRDPALADVHGYLQNAKAELLVAIRRAETST